MGNQLQKSQQPEVGGIEEFQDNPLYGIAYAAALEKHPVDDVVVKDWDNGEEHTVDSNELIREQYADAYYAALKVYHPSQFTPVTQQQPEVSEDKMKVLKGLAVKLLEFIRDEGFQPEPSKNKWFRQFNLEAKIYSHDDVVKYWLLVPDEELQQLISQLFEPQPVQGESDGWVRVEDGLPEEWKIVLASNGTYTHLCEYRSNQFYRHTDQIGSDRLMAFYYSNITHWRPLPSPPKANK
jgi:hypothetical protein